MPNPPENKDQASATKKILAGTAAAAAVFPITPTAMLIMARRKKAGSLKKKPAPVGAPKPAPSSPSHPKKKAQAPDPQGDAKRADFFKAAKQRKREDDFRAKRKAAGQTVVQAREKRSDDTDPIFGRKRRGFPVERVTTQYPPKEFATPMNSETTYFDRLQALNAKAEATLEFDAEYDRNVKALRKDHRNDHLKRGVAYAGTLAATMAGIGVAQRRRSPLMAAGVMGAGLVTAAKLNANQIRQDKAAKRAIREEREKRNERAAQLLESLDQTLTELRMEDDEERQVTVEGVAKGLGLAGAAGGAAYAVKNKEKIKDAAAKQVDAAKMAGIRQVDKAQEFMEPRKVWAKERVVRPTARKMGKASRFLYRVAAS